MIFINGRSGITLPNMTIDLALVFLEKTLVAFCSSHLATVSVDYTSPNSAGNLVVTPLKAGTTKVRVLVKDNGEIENDAMDSTFVEFTVVVTTVTGVAKAEQSTIHVFPILQTVKSV